MYLSRLQLNSSNRTIWRTIVDQPHKLHQFVMRGFPDGVKRENANILHHLEVNDHVITLLVQSDIQPDWATLDSKLLLPVSPFDPIPNPAIREVNGLGLENGRILSFRLRANPTKRLGKLAGDKKGMRVELFREEEQLDWLQKKAQDHGFQLLDVQINPEGKQTDYGRSITVFTVQYNGRLRITNTSVFQQALTKGIGPARAFGCGLLSLAPG